jgi:hypothetical protein
MTRRLPHAREPLARRFHLGKLFLLSFAILFLEMACIRWLNSSVTVLSYFNNLILISCFFGLGVGCLLSTKKPDLIKWFPLTFLTFAASVVSLTSHNISISYTGDIIFAANIEFYRISLLKISVSALLGFLINMVLFVILGQELGKQINAVGNPLRAYSYDIAGSLVGVLAFTGLAAFGVSPPVWFACALLVLLVFFDSRSQKILGVLVGCIAIFVVSWSYGKALWSPYYKIDVAPYRNEENRNLGYRISVDNLRIQDAISLGPELAGSPLRWWVPYYELPYVIARPEKVLILGAGAGNEAVIAKRFGATTIHAVEIDPVIAELGRNLHPNHPYREEGVEVFVEDARSFLANSTEKYDLIVMSALDSHKQIAGMSSLRLESFVYTREAFARVRELLRPNGVFCVNLASIRSWMAKRTYWSLTSAFGRRPVVLTAVGRPFESEAFVYASEEQIQRAVHKYEGSLRFMKPQGDGTEVRLATDNWPFMYLETNRIPNLVLGVLVATMLLCVAVVVGVEPSVRSPNFHFLFLGAGFMLLETRSVTQMGLLFGLTWIVNSVVFVSILLTILIGNHLVRKEVVPRPSTCYVLLWVTLLLGYLFPFAWLLKFGLLPRLLLSAVVIGAPILWASFLFSTSFRQVVSPNSALGSNLLGVVLGGGLEYTSSIFGLDSLYLLAVVLYLGAWWFGRFGRRDFIRVTGSTSGFGLGHELR